MKEKTEVRTIRQKLAGFVTSSLTASMAALIGGVGIVAIVFLVNLTNELQDTETRAVEQEVAIWYAERMAEVRSIRDTVENYNMTSEKYKKFYRSVTEQLYTALMRHYAINLTDATKDKEQTFSHIYVF